MGLWSNEDQDETRYVGVFDLDYETYEEQEE